MLARYMLWPCASVCPSHSRWSIRTAADVIRPHHNPETPGLSFPEVKRLCDISHPKGDTIYTLGRKKLRILTTLSSSKTVQDRSIVSMKYKYEVVVPYPLTTLWITLSDHNHPKIIHIFTFGIFLHTPERLKVQSSNFVHSYQMLTLGWKTTSIVVRVTWPLLNFGLLSYLWHGWR